MSKFIVEMAVGFCASIEVEAENREEAISKAKREVLDSPEEHICMNDGEVEGINFVQELN